MKTLTMNLNTTQTKTIKYQCECGKLATWSYMPNTSQPCYTYYCDDCVPRGCSCNEEYTVKSPQAHENGYGEDPPTDGNRYWKWIDKDIRWAYTDNKGRELPCIEYWHSDDGYEVNNEETTYFDTHNVKYYTTNDNERSISGNQG